MSVSERLELQLKGVKNNINSQYEEMFGIQERLDALKVHTIIVMMFFFLGVMLAVMLLFMVIHALLLLFMVMLLNC